MNDLIFIAKIGWTFLLFDHKIQKIIWILYFLKTIYVHFKDERILKFSNETNNLLRREILHIVVSRCFIIFILISNTNYTTPLSFSKDTLHAIPYVGFGRLGFTDL